MSSIKYNQWKKCSEYQNLLKYLLLFNGIFPLDNPSIFYRFLPYITMISLSYIACAIINFVLNHVTTNLNLATKGMAICLSLVSQIMKVFCYAIYRKDLKELHEILEDLFKRDSQNDEFISTMLQPVSLFRRVSLIHMFSAFTVSIISVCCSPLILMAIQYFHKVPQFQYHLPFPTIYPYTVIGGSALYYLHYIIEAYASCCLFSLTAGVDNAMAFYSTQIVGQFRVMIHEVELLDSTGVCNEQLKSIVNRHTTLLSCCKKLQRIHGPIELAMILCTAIILCTLVFQIDQMSSISLKKLISLLIYVSLKLLQAMIYTWPSTMITSESEKFRNAVYTCKWEYTGDKTTGIYIIMMLLAPPVVVVACGYLEISMKVFSGILQTSLSYFFLLRTLDDKGS